MKERFLLLFAMLFTVSIFMAGCTQKEKASETPESTIDTEPTETETLATIPASHPYDDPKYEYISELDGFTLYNLVDEDAKSYMDQKDIAIQKIQSSEDTIYKASEYIG